MEGIIMANEIGTKNQVKNAYEIQSQAEIIGQQAARDTASNIIKTNGEFIKNNDTFSQITNAKGERNSIAGVAFEGLADGRIKTNMNTAGKPVDSVPGDGKGIIPKVCIQLCHFTPCPIMKCAKKYFSHT